jgi:hypothetical protein
LEFSSSNPRVGTLKYLVGAPLTDRPLVAGEIP